MKISFIRVTTTVGLTRVSRLWFFFRTRCQVYAIDALFVTNYDRNTYVG